MYGKPRIFDDISQAVGRTPLVALDRLGHGLPARIALKLEYFSPGGSIKDRPAVAVLEAAEQAGKLRRGQAVIEKTSGNMGAGLAWACAVKGYKFVAVMSVGNTPERRQMIAAFGAQVVLVPQAQGGLPGHVSGADLKLVEARTQALVKKLKAFRVDQFKDASAVKAHERSTAAEIWEQTAGKVTHFCSFVGSGSTLAGVARGLKSRSAKVQVFAVEPVNSQVLAGKKVVSGSHLIQGGGYSMIPPFYEKEFVDGWLAVTDEEALSTARGLASKEGILAGFSTGANVAAALKLARRVSQRSLVVTVACDTGLKYLSTELYPVP